MNWKIATPVSTLFTDQKSIDVLTGLSDALEIRFPSKPVPFASEYLYHAEESIVIPWTDEEIEHIASVIEKYKLEIISFHVASCFQKPKIIEGIYCPEGIQMTEKEMLENAHVNITKLRKKISINNCIIENNNYFKTGAYEIVTEPQFLNALMKNLDVGLLLDIGHAEISAYHSGISFEQYLNNLDLSRVLQIHLSSPTLENNSMKDSHAELTSHDWETLRRVLLRVPNVRYVTIEYYKDFEKLCSMLKEFKKMLK